MPVAGSISSADGVGPISANNTLNSSINRIPDVDVDIAVLDTGVSFDEQDLNVFRNITFVNGSLTGEDDQGLIYPVLLLQRMMM